MERVIKPAHHYHECRQCGADLGICACQWSALKAHLCEECSNDPEPEKEE